MHVHMSEQVTMTMDFTPNPPVPAQPLTVFGDAVASSGPAPTGNVTVFVSLGPASHVKYCMHSSGAIARSISRKCIHF